MFKMTPREALAIQAEQVEHYKRFRPDMAKYIASLTHVDGVDLDEALPTWEINRMIPRGRDIERAAGIEDQGGN